ncbi:MAG TPA: diguanylate cyclase, partial [Rhizomicrobium sp.]|nr:diguanylate cyclase [Rhizomicrobium sp.]
MHTALQKRDDLAQLGTLEDQLRLLLATQAAGCAAFDWDIASGTIRWDGATDILPAQLDTSKARSFLDGIPPERRRELQAVLESRDHASAFFLADIEIASALGAVNFTLTGTRMPDESGRTARLVGLMRDTTERSREVRRLSYLATRDELTGHLNRNALREELSQAIESAKAENRDCAFLVASVDRLAMINDSFGIDTGDEVILAVGERLARTLRGSDVIGRTAGNKFGVLLKSCREHEIAVVAGRLRAAVRAIGIESRGGLVAATCSVGAVWLPQAASTSQEAMLRAEQALDKARANGRDGFASYHLSPQRETARLRQMQIADEVVLALKENRLKLAYQPIVAARSRKVSHYECLLRMAKPDGGI